MRTTRSTSSRPSLLLAFGASTLAIAAFAPAPTLAQEPPSLARVFPKQAALFADAHGFVRVPLPAAVTAQMRADLSDLRVFDSAGREKPYALAPGGTPVLVLEAFGHRDAAFATLRFGGGRALAPEYEEVTEPSWQAAVGRAGSLPAARVDDVVPNPGYATGSVFQDLMIRPGPAVDLTQFSHLRPLDTNSSIDGLAKQPLGIWVLARAREDLGDLRVVDGRTRLVPFVVRRDSARWRIAVELGERRSDGAASRYPLRLPVPVVRASSLTLAVDEGGAGRTVRVVGTLERGGERTLGTGPLGGTAIALEPVRVTALDVVVEGGGAPVALSRATLEGPDTELFVVVPGGAYVLLAGSPDARPVAQEIDRYRDLVLSLRATAARPERLMHNVEHRPAGAAAAAPPDVSSAPDTRAGSCAVDQGRGFDTRAPGVVGSAFVASLVLVRVVSRRRAASRARPRA